MYSLGVARELVSAAFLVLGILHVCEEEIFLMLLKCIKLH